MQKTLLQIVQKWPSSRRDHPPDPRLHQEGPPRKDWLDLNEAIREVVALTRGEAFKNGVLVRMQLAEGLRPVAGDRV
ncbi:MAG TPA: hypothetical protein VFG62_23835 [Rhodopila sp.]|nr:hypothetical protein [Rhodopila sp.]